MKGVYTFTVRHAVSGRVLRTYTYENLVPTVARAMLVNQLTDATPTNNPLLTHVALGSGTTPPANGDTTLETEVYRNAVASMVGSSNVASVTGFFNATETSGTYREAGLFSEGTGSPDTGVLVSHVAINITKSLSETLTMDWSLTIT